MTEIIPGLQGDLPANSKKGIPFVSGKYVSPFLLSLILISTLHCIYYFLNFVRESRFHLNHVACPDFIRFLVLLFFFIQLNTVRDLLHAKSSLSTHT